MGREAKRFWAASSHHWYPPASPRASPNVGEVFQSPCALCDSVPSNKVSLLKVDKIRKRYFCMLIKLLTNKFISHINNVISNCVPWFWFGKYNF